MSDLALFQPLGKIIGACRHLEKLVVADLLRVRGKDHHPHLIEVLLSLRRVVSISRKSWEVMDLSVSTHSIIMVSFLAIKLSLLREFSIKQYLTDYYLIVVSNSLGITLNRCIHPCLNHK